MASWLRRPDVGELPAGDPWRKDAIAQWLEGRGTWDDLRYIVVDELHEGIASLVVSPWPHTDARGRLHFGGEAASRRLATPAAALEAQLRSGRRAVVAVPVDEAAMLERPLEVGDVFAAFVALPAEGDGDGSPRDPGDWLRGDVLDVTALAVEAAKTQASATAAGVPDEGLLEVIGAEQVEPDDGPHG